MKHFNLLCKQNIIYVLCITIFALCLQTAELAAAQEKQMEVCDVCGAFLIVGDAQQRIDDHLMGKQHVGYARLKSALQEMMVDGVLLYRTYILKYIF